MGHFASLLDLLGIRGFPCAVKPGLLARPGNDRPGVSIGVIVGIVEVVPVNPIEVEGLRVSEHLGGCKLLLNLLADQP